MKLAQKNKKKARKTSYSNTVRQLNSFLKQCKRIKNKELTIMTALE